MPDEHGSPHIICRLIAVSFDISHGSTAAYKSIPIRIAASVAAPVVEFGGTDSDVSAAN